MTKFTAPEGAYVTITVNGVTDDYITIPDAAKIIQQQYPHYRAANLYNAARTIRNGKAALETVNYRHLGIARVLIARSVFEKWLRREKLGTKSTEVSNNGKAIQKRK